MKSKPEYPVLVTAALVLAACRTLSAGPEPVHEIAGRVLAVSADNKTATINRGQADRLVVDSLCYFRPNRGTDDGDVEWDILLATGRVKAVGRDTAVISFVDIRDTVRANDCCEIYAAFDPRVLESDLGIIARWDIAFTDLAGPATFYRLSDLIANPAPAALDSIVDRMVAEVRQNAAAVDYRASLAMGGLFDGQTVEDALAATTPEHIRQYLEYVRYYPGRYINYDWKIVSTYAWWVFNGTKNADRDRRLAVITPLIDSALNRVQDADFHGALDYYKQALAVVPDYAPAKDRIELINTLLQNEKIFEDDPNDVAACFALGRAYYDLDLYDRALEFLNKARMFGYDSVKVDLNIGYTLVAQQEYSRAKKIFAGLERSFPKDANILKWLSYSEAREKQKKSKSAVESFIMTGDIKYREDNYNDAIAEYKKALAREPHSDRIQDLIEKSSKRRKAKQRQDWAADYWLKGRFEEAKVFWWEAYNLCMEIGDTVSMEAVADQMADAMYDAMFYPGAREIYSLIIAINPGSYDSYISMSNCFKEENNYEEAIAWARRGIEVKPEDAWAYNILGLIYSRTGELDRAIEHFLKASEMDDDYKYPNFNAALIYSKKGRYEDARRYLQKALAIDIEYRDARSDLVDLQCLLETESLLAANPDDIEARLRYGRALHNLEVYDRAIEELGKVTAQKKNDAVALAYRGFAYNESGRYAEAKELFEEACRIKPWPNIKAWILYNGARAVLKNEPENWEAYLMLAESDMYWEEYDDVLSELEQALQLGADSALVYQRSAAARYGLEGSKLYELSTEHYGRAEYERAIELADSALRLYRRIGNIYGEMWALLRLGWSHAGLFKHAEALNYYDAATLVADQLFDQKNKGHCLSAIGDYHWNMGDYRRALEYKEKTRQVFHENNALIDEAHALVSIGSLTGGGGEFNRMIDLYNQALAIYQKTMSYTGESYALGSLGRAYIDDGDYAAALDYQLKALKVAQRYNDKWRELSAYQGIGNIYEDLGDTLNALRYLKHYLDAATALGSKTDRANALNGTGLIYLELVKDNEKAYEFFVRSRDLSKVAGYTLGEAVAIANIGVTYSRRGLFNDALPYQEQALAMVREENASYQEMQGLNEYGETYLGLKRFDAALDCFRRSIELAVTIGVNREKWRYELNAGITYEEKGALDTAVVYYEQAAATLTTIKNKIKSEKLQKGFTEQDRQVEVYKRLVDLLIKLGRPDDALKYIEESKSRIIKDAFGNIKPRADDEKLKETLDQVDIFERRKETLEQKLVEEKQKPPAEQDQTKIGILTNTLASTEGEFNQWMLKLKFQNRKMYDALTINPTTLGDIQNDIPEKALLLEYFSSSDKLYIFCISRQHFIAKSVDISDTEINNSVDYFVGLLKNHEPDLDEDLRDAARKLYGYLFKPVEDEISGYENLVVVPYGSLYYLPFHALMRDDGRYVIEWKRLSYTTSATFADLLKREDREVKNMLAIGNPDGSLPGAADEVKEVGEAIFKEDAIIWTLDQATKARFREKAKDFNIVHLATHGYIQNNPLESYLLFAGSSAEEQRLTLLEVAGYTDLRERTDLVFLSACQTAMEKGATTGSELISLAEAFAMAGPPTLIATLWQVSDLSTRKLVVDFYERLKKGKSDKLGALRAAQLALLGTTEYRHPFYWAPFVLIGDWR